MIITMHLVFFGHLPNHHIQPLTAINNVNIGIGKLFIFFRKNLSYILAHYLLNGVDRCKFDYTLRFALESFKTQSHDASFSAYSKSLFVSVYVTNKKKILILGIRNLYLTYPRGKVYIKDYPRILRN